MKTILRVRMGQLFFLLVVTSVCLTLISCSAYKKQSDSEDAALASYEMDEEPNGDVIVFSHDSGIYPDESISITLTAPEGCTIAYTTDGSTPTASNITSSEAELSLDRNLSRNLVAQQDLMINPDIPHEMFLDDPTLPFGVVVTACAVNESGEFSNPVSKTYFLGVDFADRFPNCVVVSLTTDPKNLLDYDTGILANGAVYDEWRQSEAAQEIIEKQQDWLIETNSTQRGKDWERPCHLQIYDSKNNFELEQNAGVRISGGTSSRESQKSFNFYFRDQYGSTPFESEVFDGLDVNSGFRLRAGGNNARFLKFKDAFLMDLLSDCKCLTAQSRTAVLFINGEYWGPYLLSEKISDQLVHDRYGVDKDQVVIMKEGEVDEGVDEDIALYDELMAYAQKDLTDPETWQAFCNVMDIKSMADYFAARVYIGDADWSPVKNDLLWRTRDNSYNDGRWQYILYDIEFSSGMYGLEASSADKNHLETAMEAFPLFAQAMRNQEFSSLFLESLKTIGQKNCNPERVRFIMQNYLEVWEPLLPDFYKRFGDWQNGWDSSLALTLEFFDARYDVIIPIAEEFKNSH